MVAWPSGVRPVVSVMVPPSGMASREFCTRLMQQALQQARVDGDRRDVAGPQVEPDARAGGLGQRARTRRPGSASTSTSAGWLISRRPKASSCSVSFVARSPPRATWPRSSSSVLAVCSASLPAAAISSVIDSMARCRKPSMAPSRLLKSCAMPPAIRRRLSSRSASRWRASAWRCRISRPARSSAATTSVTSSTITTAPASSASGSCSGRRWTRSQRSSPSARVMLLR